MSEEKLIPEEEFSVQSSEDEQEDDRRRKMLLILLLLLLLLCCICGLFYRYLQKPQALPDIVPLPVSAEYPPHYLYSIYGVDRPVGVAVSPDGERIYVAESAGDRMVKMFDPDGNLLASFAPPDTRSSERSPVYITTDALGQVYVSDRLQHAIFVYNEDGLYLDTILDTELTLGEYVAKHTGGLQPETTFSFNIYWQDVRIVPSENEAALTIPAPDRVSWAPLGLAFDAAGDLWVTNVAKTGDILLKLPAEMFGRDVAPWTEFGGPVIGFGEYGEEQGQFLFANATAVDSQGRVFASDGNNGRIQVWSADGAYQFSFGRGSGDGALSLPRGIFIDTKDRLYVVDAVGQDIKIFDVSAEEPRFLFTIGELGLADGQFNYPNDIEVDETGRLYIIDRENQRVQVWLY
ncbi:MAG: hypothetical protein L3J16_05200 [Anaerolineales bacterium]|nr:hypothetical protein [Anaerolineales bacterium]